VQYVVAAEFFGSKHKMLEQLGMMPRPRKIPLQYSADGFKGQSEVVAARRALDMGLISDPSFFRFYRADAPLLQR